jgi:hypothetical protein
MAIALILIALIVLDIILLVYVVRIGGRNVVTNNLLVELSEERSMLKELRNDVQEELAHAQKQSQIILERVKVIATEIDHDVKNNSQNIAKEIDSVLTSLAQKLDEPMKEISKKQIAIESLLKRMDREKLVLQKQLDRSEKMCMFLDKKVPYEEVLREIEDKKYQDARQLVAMGQHPDKIAKDLGLSSSEVRIIAGLS